MQAIFLFWFVFGAVAGMAALPHLQRLHHGVRILNHLTGGMTSWPPERALLSKSGAARKASTAATAKRMMPSRNSRRPVNREESGLSILALAVPLGASASQAGSPTAIRQRPMTARSGAIPNTKNSDA